MGIQGEYEERLLTGYTGRVFLVASIGYLVVHLGRNILSPLLPNIMDSLQITSFQAGVALSLLGVMYAASMYPGGHLSDRLSRKTVIVGAASLTLVGFAVVGVAASYPPFLIAAAIIGLGAGLYWIALRALLADLFIVRRGQAFGLQDALGSAGPLAAAGGAIVVLWLGNWQLAFPAVIVALVGMLVLIHVWLREPYVLSPVSFEALETGRRVFSNQRIRRLSLAYTAVIFPVQGVIGFLPAYLQLERGFSPTLASLGFALLFLGAMISMPIAGSLGDRFGYLYVAIGGICLAGIGLGTFLVAPGRTPVLIGVLIYAGGTFAFPPVIQAHLMTVFPDASMGGDYGAFKTIYAGIGSLGPAYVGLIAGLVSYAIAFAGLMGCLILAVVVLTLNGND